MMLRGEWIRLRAVEPDDVDLLFVWENDETVWQVSGTVEPFSRAQMERFVAAQCESDIVRRGDLRLIIEAPDDAKHPAARPDDDEAARAAVQLADDEATHPAARPDDEVPERTCGPAHDSDQPPVRLPSPDTGTHNDPIRTHFRPVGAIDLFDYDPLHQRAGAGILIHRCDDRGRGYATDALDTLCRYARERLRLHQLWCEIDPDNTASLRLFRRAGFVQSGLKRDWQWSPQGYRDILLLQKIFD